MYYYDTHDEDFLRKINSNLSYSYGTQDGHGGMAAEHRAEMEHIAKQVATQQIKALVPKMAREIYKESLKDVLKGLQYDLDTIVNIAFDDGRDIFTSSKSRKVVSDAIYKEIIKGLGNLEQNKYVNEVKNGVVIFIIIPFLLLQIAKNR